MMITIKTALRWLSLICALLVGTSAWDSAYWMSQNMALLGRRKLSQMCMPGTHNSGMNKLNGGTAFARGCNVLNQSQTIRMQLELGVRYFDIRPVISGGSFKTGHYSKILGGHYQGGNGQFIDSIVSDINGFTRNHKEVIIIILSHSLNTDVDNPYRSFFQSEWNRLFNLLDETDDLFYGPWDAYLPAYTLGNLTNSGKRAAVLYIVDEDGIGLGGRWGKGYFFSDRLNLYDQYSDTDKVSTMIQDQFNKMHEWAWRRHFLLSWTLTLRPFDAITCPLRNTLASLAKEANSKLAKIRIEFTSSAYPNIIYLDYVETTLVTELAMEINRILPF